MVALYSEVVTVPEDAVITYDGKDNIYIGRRLSKK